MSSEYKAPAPATLGHLLQPTHDARPAIVLPKSAGALAGSFTYAQLRQLIHSLQRQLIAGGLQPAQRVALSLTNGIELVAAFLAVTNSRAVASPLNPAYTKDEVKFYLKDMTCSCIILMEGAAPVARAAALEMGVLVYDLKWAEGRTLHLIAPKQQGPGVRSPDTSAIAKAATASTPLPSPQPKDVALILHTSGTTSAPKGVPLTHGNLTRTLTNVCNTYRLQSSDVCMLVMPLFHVHGLMACLLSPLASGGCVVIPPKFSAGTFWSEFEENGCTWYSAVPTIHQILLAHEVNSPSVSHRKKLKFIRSCSSALAAATWTKMEETFKVPVVEAYAMTEASHQMTSNPLPPGVRKPGSVGLGQGVDVAILDGEGNELPRTKEGEICIRGSNVTSGYLNNPSANAASFTKGGFFRTGDQGYMDKEGYVYVTGRLKELINRGGEKIAPAEVDSALLSAPGVGEAVAFGIPHEMYGQEVAAAIVTSSEVWGKLQSAGKVGSEARTKAEAELQKSILSHASKRLAPFKLPKKIFFSDSLPKTATGKIQRRHVAEYFLKQNKEQTGAAGAAGPKAKL
jgi:acyl-CoA synthetase (AMP-forming)/AMP-acid ligase II